MYESDIHLKLLANVPIKIEGIGQFKLPTIQEMIDMGESVYYHYLSMVTFSKEYLSANNLDDFSDLEVLATSIFYDQTFHEIVNNSFKLFFGKEIQVVKLGDMPILYFDELSNDSVLTEEKWEFIKRIAKIGNFIEDKKKKEEYQAGNERARKFLEEQKKRKEMVAKLKKNKEQVNLHSILSAVAWRTTGVNDLLKLTVYQLYNGYFRLGLIDNYNHVTTGIYTGNVDGSKIKLPDINWANIIKIN